MSDSDLDFDAHESYRNELTAALLRIERLQDELAIFRADPAYERVDIAEEELERVKEARARWQKLLPRICIGSFAAMAAYALTQLSLPDVVEGLAYFVSAAGSAIAVVTMLWMLVLAAQGSRPKRVRELERRVRIAKGDVGKRVRVASAETRMPSPLPEELVEEPHEPRARAQHY